MFKKITALLFSALFIFSISIYAIENFQPQKTLNKGQISTADFSAENSGAVKKDSFIAESVAGENSSVLHLNDLKFEKSKTKITVVLYFNGPPKYKKTQIEFPPWLVIDIKDCQNELKPINFSVDSDFLTDIRTSQLIIEPPVARVVFHLTEMIPSSIDVSGNKIIVSFLLPKRAELKTKKPAPPTPKSMTAAEVIKQKKALKKEGEFELPKEQMKMAQKEFDDYLQTLIKEKKKIYSGQTPPEVVNKEKTLKKAAQPEAAKPEKLQTRSALEKMKDLVSMDFKDADLQTVLEILAKEKGLNIVSTEKIKGSISVNFDKVPLKEAFLSILKANGYSYVVENNIIRIINMANPKDMLETKIFETKYIAADAIIKSIKSVLTPKGKIEPFFPYNSATVIGKNQISGEYSNKFIVTDVTPVLEEISGILKEIDKKPGRIALEISVISSESKSDTQLGIEWPLSMALGQAALTSQSNQEDNVIYPHKSMLKLGYMTDNEYKILMNFVKMDPTFSIISKSKLMCFSDQVSEYKMTQKVYFDKNSSYEVGTYLSFIPRLRDDEIILDLYPKFRTISGYETRNKNKFPVISETKTNTKVIIPNNEAIALGGLQRDISTEKNGMFNFLSKKNVRKEKVFIFIHPVVINN